MSFSQYQTDRTPFVEVFLMGERIPVHDYLQSIDIEMGLNTSYIATLRFFDPTWVTIEKAIYAAEDPSKRSIVIHYGWIDDPNEPPYNVFTGLVRYYTPTFQHDGVQIEIQALQDFTDQEVIINAGWPTGTRPSDVVADICRYFGWIPVIEPTKAWDKEILALNVRPLQWIRKTFCADGGRGCVSEISGATDYICVRDDRAGKRLHFHSKAYQRPQVTRSYVFARDKKAQVISFTPSINDALATALGGGAAVQKAFDPREGVVIQDAVSPDRRPGFRVPMEASLLGGGRWKPVNMGFPFHLPNTVSVGKEQTAEQVMRRLELTYQLLSSYMFTADLQIMGDAFINLMDLIEIAVLLPDNTPHYLSGIYQVDSIRHTLQAGAFTTSLGLRRTALLRGAVKVEGPSQQIERPEIPPTFKVIRRASPE